MIFSSSAKLSSRPSEASGGTPFTHSLAWIALVALVVRALAFLGRGDYVAYDEAWYTLLGRNLIEGRGYTLAGLRHVTLSPLYPVVVGITDALTGNGVLAGRILACVFGALLVFPSYYLFRRMGGHRVALVAALFIAVLPALAPFAAPKWVGWDLWVGAEPLYHFLIFSALALLVAFLRAPTLLRAACFGAIGALAYLTRAEGVVVFGAAGGLAALALLARRRWREMPRLAVALVAFAIVAAPYWIYLHDALGVWTLTGRGVEVAVVARENRESTGDESSSVIERMLWSGDYAYAERLYALHPSGTRMASDYWGVPSTDNERPAPLPAAPAPAAQPPDTLARTADSAASAPQPSLPSSWTLYARTLALLVPWWLWPLVLGGLLVRRRFNGPELVAGGGIVLSAAAIAILVAVDPRTQTFVLPLVAYFAARGTIALARFIADRRARPGLERPLAAGLAAVVAIVMLIETAGRTYAGRGLTTEVQLMGTEYRLLGRGLRELVPEGQSIVSWHPAVAVHARRDWHPLPLAITTDVIRYANAVDAHYVVFGGHNPSALRASDLPREYLVLLLRPGQQARADSRISFVHMTPLFVVGRLDD